MTTNDMLTIAVSKGRIYDEALPLLAAADVVPVEDPARSRKLILATSRPDVRLVIVRASDVPTYVQYGGADLGVAGKDVLMEHGGEGLYEPLDLGIARCRLMVAGPKGVARPARRLRVATKYVKAARAWFAERGIEADIIKLYGSMELAPLVDMADCIVDLVDTGNTLKANGLEATDLIADISSRLIVNRASLKMKHAAVARVMARIEAAVRARSGGAA